MNDTLSIEPLLKDLDKQKLIAFCVAISQRQFPNFALFSSLVDFGDAKKMSNTIDGIWQSLVPGGAQMNFALQLTKIEENMPDLNEFDMYGVSPALDAITCLHSTVSCLLDGEFEEAVTIGQVSQETVAGFIEVTQGEDQMSDTDIMRLISNHPLMEQEEEFQAQVIEKLQSVKSLDKKFLAELRELARNEGVSNIGISIGDS